MRLKEIAALCGGRLFGDGDREIASFFTDSREAAVYSRQGSIGAMFVPVKGENVDAHSFIGSVFAAGAASFSEKELPGAAGDYVLVPDNVKALQMVGLHHRQQFQIPVVGITGSVGKTTAKEMAALALDAGKKTFRTAGNANSQIGVPLTLLKLTAEDEAAVIEMGMSLPGEMARIAYAVRPTIGVFTGVGVSHIEFHGSREKIMEEKLHMADYFTKDSTLFINGDDDLLCTLKGKVPYRVVAFGLGAHCDWRAAELQENEDSTRFTCLYPGGQIEVLVPVPGLHNVRNALSSLAVAKAAGVDVHAAAAAIAAYTPPDMRQQIKRAGALTVIDDSYNASPDSMLGALQILAGMKAERKIALLADMLELGSYAETGHRQVGERAKELQIDYMIAFGEQAAWIAAGFGGEHCRYFTNYQEALAELKALAIGEAAVLVKGSRGMKTDRFVKALLEES